VSWTIAPWLDPAASLDVARNASAAMVRRAIGAEEPGVRELAALLSPAAGAELETMACRAQAITRRHFGRTISLYAPLYISNYCPSTCTYCGFAADRGIRRYKLKPAELDRETAALRAMGLEEILLLTGDRAKTAGFEVVRDSVRFLAGRFHNVAAEVFAMTTPEYRGLAEAGCTGVTLYQETYQPALYQMLHLRGEKSDYAGRVDAPARALAGGIRMVGVGVLLGLTDPLFDLIALYRHAVELRRRFMSGGVAISFPRIRPEPGGYVAHHPVTERYLAQVICAFRICLPDVPLVLSTRETARFRDGMAGVGISKMSVASRTTVGGYADDAVASSGQFEVDDTRDVPAFRAALLAKGLQPVFKNWDAAYREAAAS
jgi:2-iminoacetate synthase